jgi:thermopsin
VTYTPKPWGRKRRRWLVVTVIAFVAAIATMANVSTTIHTRFTSGSPSGAVSQAASGTVQNGTSLPGGASAQNSSALDRERFILDALRRDKIPSKDMLLPNFLEEGNHAAGPVKELYAHAPAPMGVADIGVRDVSNHMVAYELNSSSLEGTADIQSADPMYMDGLSPDTFTIQQNTNLNGVTLFGNPNYVFWMQNTVNYTVSTHKLFFEGAIWNSSNSGGWMSSNLFYAHGKNGTNVPPYYYFSNGPTLNVGLPFRVSLYTNSSIWKDRPITYFNYSLSSSSLGPRPISGSFDYVVFNSSRRAPLSPAPAPYFQINGNHPSPVGLLDDSELDIIGNNDATTTTFYGLNATLSIAYWNSSANGYTPDPAAYNAGSNTAETSEGIESYWTPDTPAVAHIGPGPSFIEGLWNVSGDPGAVKVTQKLSPANAFLFVNMGNTLNVSASQWVPTSPTGTTEFVLPVGSTYYFEYLMSEYQPAGSVVDPAQDAVLNTTMVFDSTYGVYTPLVAWGNSELANISSRGSGTSADPYVLYNNEYGPLYPQFAQLNEYLFPVFSGILLVGTSASVDITPPSFAVVYPSWFYMNVSFQDYGMPAGIPSTNNLQLQFLDTKDVALTNGTSITGWFWAYAGLGLLQLSNVMFWDCSNSLVAGNTFRDEGSSLAFFGGTNNTVWGNYFLDTSPAASDQSTILYGGMLTEGLVEIESGDSIYNNFFSVPLPALTYATDPTTNASEMYTETWNLPRQPSTDYRYVDGVNLTGSIIGTRYQGGNYWSNYGSQSDPFGVLPYNDDGSIHVGGDFVPLVSFTLYQITASELGLPLGARWSITALGVSYVSRDQNIQFYSPNGTFAYNATIPLGYAGTTNGSYIVNGRPTYINLQFSPQSQSSSLSLWQVGLLIMGLFALAALIFFIVLAATVRSSERIKYLFGESPPNP